MCMTQRRVIVTAVLLPVLLSRISQRIGYALFVGWVRTSLKKHSSGISAKPPPSGGFLLAVIWNQMASSQAQVIDLQTVSPKKGII